MEFRPASVPAVAGMPKVNFQDESSFPGMDQVDPVVPPAGQPEDMENLGGQTLFHPANQFCEVLLCHGRHPPRNPAASHQERKA